MSDAGAGVFIFLFFVGLIILIAGFIVMFWANMEHFTSGIILVFVGMLMMASIGFGGGGGRRYKGSPNVG